LTRDERWNALLEVLAGRGRLQVEDAARDLGVSAATIRRDLDELAAQQMVTRTRGGAVAHSVAYDLPLRYKKARHAPEKQRIGAAAATLVAPGAVVGINGGTTTTEAARALASRADLHADGSTMVLTVVTNALNIANELTVRPHVKIVVTGGVVRPQSYELTGPYAAETLAEISLDVAIIGVDGIDADHGATAHHEGEAAVNRLMAERARLVVVVSDSSKLDHRAFARICGVRDIDVLVTDTAASDEMVKTFTEAGIRVLQA
jgi:DeoR family transcriptional regulator of aga operon